MISNVINPIKHNFAICRIGCITAIIFNMLAQFLTYLVGIHLKDGTRTYTTHRYRCVTGFR
ncbi:hypothetical protein VP02_08870 [Pseudomonas ogarae]|uniref:Uncharacterized protein n=1 Tax=Pseudomonas kilonensis TaxID=132476 RepID=A0A0F4XRB0_9PSED|nr:hypothetical protein VP02_08870 [Pseudomonas ogarae]KQW15646.1 hypothetical protein ASC85_30220 [Pseudomonas sp. Root401]